MRKSGIIGACLAVAAVIVGGVYESSQRDALRSSGGSARSRARAAGAPSPSLGPVLEIGTEHIYDVSFAQSVRTEGATSPEVGVTLEGTWAVVYAGSDERGLVFRAQLRDGTPAVRRGGADASAAFSETLRSAYYFTTTQEGRLIELHFDAKLDDITRTTLATLASTFQVSAQSRAATWEATESDSLGDYRARYTRGGELHRERLAYNRVAGGNVIGASIVKTGTDIALGDDGWPDRIAGSEATRIGTKEVGVVVEATFALRHRAIARGVKPGWHDGLASVAIDAAPSRASQDQEDRDMVGGASLDDLLAELERAGDDDKARGYQFLRMAALFRLDPDAAHAGARLVIDGKANEAGMVVGALGEAGTPEAQRALREVLDAPIASDSRTKAAIALGLTESPTQGTMDALAQAATSSDGDVASTATLAQGNAALRMRDDAPDASVHQVDALLARLEGAQSDEERALILRALGNTGDPRIVNALDRALASGNVMVRLAATEALRLLPGDAIDARIIARITDRSSLVRAAAVFASGERDLAAFVPAFGRALRADTALEVRRAIVELAAARMGELPALRALVEWTAAHESDAELRAAAKGLLAGHTS